MKIKVQLIGTIKLWWMPRALLPHKTSDVWNNFYKFNIINLGDLLDIDIKFNLKLLTIENT